MTLLATTGPSGIGSDRTAISSSDALPQIPHEAVATKWRQRATPEPVEPPAPVAAKERVA